MDIQALEITAAGGQIDKFMGDGLMAFWKGPDAQRLAQSAEAAVNAALQTVRAMSDVIAAETLPLDIRIGLHAGPVILGDFGGSERIAFTAIGEAVNTASRYEQATGPAGGGRIGRVRISDTLFAHLASTELTAQFETMPIDIQDKHGRTYKARVSII
jgi:class 3 adenylate cyclase